MRAFRSSSSWQRAAVALGLGLALAGCGEEKHGPAGDAGAPDGPTGPVVGGKLGQALASAAAAQATARAVVSNENGPPENGVFGPGAADKAHLASAPATVELLGEGSGPKVALSLLPGSLPELKTTLTVGFKFGPQQALPVIEYALVARLDKPKDDKADKADPAADPSAPARVVVKVASAVAARDQPGQLPKEVAEQIGKLKGAEIRYRLTAQGVMSELTFSLPKDADPGLDLMMRSLMEALSLLDTPLPVKPVGEGGYWIVTDRVPSVAGIDLVRYRVYRVTKIQKDRAWLSCEVRQYAAKDELDGGPAKGMKARIERLESQGKAGVDWAPQFLPAGAEGGQRLGAALGGTGSQRLMIQTDLSARLGTGRPLDAASAQGPAQGP